MKIQLSDEEIRIQRAAQAVRLGVNMSVHDNLWFIRIVSKTWFWLIVGLLLLGWQSDNIEPFLHKWQAYQEAHSND